MRWAAVIGLLALVGACTSTGQSPIERMRPVVENYLFGEEPAPERPPITRAQLNTVPFATISIKTAASRPAYVVAVADNGGYITYQDLGRRSVVLRGGLLTATHGLGYNLSAIKQQADDPVAVPTPLADWPAGVTRSYEFSRIDLDDFIIAVECRYTRVANEVIEIVELQFPVVRMHERCRNNRRQFTNTYWVDPATGFIWKSEQWIGPRQVLYTIEVLRPYEGQG